VAKKKKTEEEQPVTTEQVETAPELTSYLYSGKVVTTRVIGGKEYIFAPGRTIDLPQAEEVETMVRKKLLAKYEIHTDKH